MTGDLMYRVRAVTTGWGGAPGLNQFYFRPDVTNPDANAAGAAEPAARVQAAFSNIADLWPSGWTCNVQNVVDVIDADNGSLVSSNAVGTQAPVPGVGPGGFGPQVAMICIGLLTDGIIDGRRVRGRIFLGPVAALTDTDGTPNAAAMARANAFSTSLETAPGGGSTLSVWSRRRGASLSHPTGLGGTAHEVTAHQVRDTYAFLSSRRQ